MSDPDPEQDWNQMTPLAASSWQRNRRMFLSLGVAVALFVVGLVVFVVMANV